MQSVLAQVRGTLDRITEAATADKLAEVKDGLAGLRTDLRLLPDQVNQAIAAGVLHAVSVALTDVRRPLEAVGHITEQLGAVLGRMDALTEVRDQVAKFEGVPAAIMESGAEMSGALGSISSDLAALITRITGMDARVATSSAALEPVRLSIGEIDRRLGHVDTTLAELRRLASVNGLNLDSVGATVREAVHTSVRDHLRDAIRDLVHDAVQDAMGDVLQDAVRNQMAEAVETSTHESERRIAAHLDDAMLVLAEMVLRRQYGGPSVAITLSAEGSEPGASHAKPATPAARAGDMAGDAATGSVKPVEPASVKGKGKVARH